MENNRNYKLFIDIKKEKKESAAHESPQSKL